MLSVPIPDLYALVEGETIIVFVDRSMQSPGTEVDLEPSGTRPPGDLKPAYERWSAANAPTGRWTAIIEEVHPAVALDPEAGAARHILASTPTAGDILVVRVLGESGPVLSDEAYAARQRSLESALG